MVRHRRRLQPVSTHVLPPTRPGLAAHLPPSPRAHCRVHARGSHRFFGHRAHLCLRRRCTTAEQRLTGRPSMLCCSCAHALAHNKLLGKQGGGLELIRACDSHRSKASSQVSTSLVALLPTPGWTTYPKSQGSRGASRCRHQGHSTSRDSDTASVHPRIQRRRSLKLRRALRLVRRIPSRVPLRIPKSLSDLCT